jgi:(1->4)-alpha-D-glucan 1-alpha-D-glucosylmutase
MRRGLVSTYRLQLTPDFGFAAAAALADYLGRLGVSHLYASPYLQAARGSQHGYDVVDPTRVNEELGGAAGHRVLVQALGEHDLGQVLDIVPNHMSIGSAENAWWRDVLENGPSSLYASYFDVDWEHPEARLQNKVLLPVLGDHYGRVLEAGEIRLRRDGEEFQLAYHEHRFAVAPRPLGELLRGAAARAEHDELGFIAGGLSRLPLPTATDRDSTRRRHRDKQVLLRLLNELLAREPALAAAVDEELDRINENVDELDAFIDRQNYRLSYWRSAGRDLGYRRFFDINTLVGLRVEDEAVFEETHRLVLGWVREGVLDGLRIDHPDGLRDPESYLRRLRGAAPAAWIVVEKILEPDERLPATWPVDGTTGYDFLNTVGGVLLDPRGEEPLTRLYASFTGETTDYHALVREKKHQVLHDVLGSDVNRLTELMLRICERHRRYRDFTRHEVHEVIREVVACFPVYRSYVNAETGRLSREDRQAIQAAVAGARAARDDLDPELIGFLEELLSLRWEGELESELAMRFQQLTSPAMAKGAEDTAFYSFNRFVALNEVGGDPSRFGLQVEEFHEAMLERQARAPQAMLTTSTHDTKRGEDVRARLWLLAEIPDRWEQAVERWSALAERHRTGALPDRNTEYLLYQTLVGAWPIGVERLTSYMEKAVREAKVHTSWTRQDQEYEAAVMHLARGVLKDEELRASIEEFVRPLVGPGRVNALAQLLVKLTAPGIPDLYQGTELWESSLVDPDNRRPVDFARRRHLLERLDETPVADPATDEEGVSKLRLAARALALRRQRPEAFGTEATYRPLAASGPFAGHLVAFTRSETVAAVAPRWPLARPDGWEETAVELPPGRWRHVVTGAGGIGGPAQIGALLADFPVALLAREEE